MYNNYYPLCRFKHLIVFRNSDTKYPVCISKKLQYSYPREGEKPLTNNYIFILNTVMVMDQTSVGEKKVVVRFGLALISS